MGKLVMTLGSENVFLSSFIVNGVEYGTSTPWVDECCMAKEVVITNFRNHEYVDIAGAKKENDRWYITDKDGMVYEFDTQYKLDNAFMIRFTDYGCIIKDIERVMNEVNVRGFERYRMVGYVNGARICTGIMKKIWKDDDGKYHCITDSHSHFVWTFDET